MCSVLYLLKIEFILGIAALSVKVFSLTKFHQPDTVERWLVFPF